MMEAIKRWNWIAIVALMSVSVIWVGCASLPATQYEVPPSKSETATNVPTETPLPSPEKGDVSTNLPTETPLSLPEQAHTSTVSPSKEMREEIVIVYKRSGGIAGLDEQYTIFLNGRITTNDGREWWSDAHEVSRLVGEIEKLGFFELDADYLPRDTCCDRFTYELSVYSDDQTITVTTVDAAPNAPDKLWAVLGLVQGFLDQFNR